MPDELPPTATPEIQTEPEPSDVYPSTEDALEHPITPQATPLSVQDSAFERADEQDTEDAAQPTTVEESVSAPATTTLDSPLGDDDDVLDAPVEVPESSTPAVEEPPPENKKQWYVVKVQSGREDSIRAAIERKVRIEGLEEYFGKIIIPVEKVEELRRGKRVYKSIKLYPGYIFAEVEFNDRILYLFREVSGVGDFVGGGPLGKAPTPMRPEEVERMINRQPTAEKPGEEGATEKPREVVRARPRFSVGDRLKVCDGNFAGMEGEVIDITEDKVKLQVLVLGMPVTIDLEFWQVESL